MSPREAAWWGVLFGLLGLLATVERLGPAAVGRAERWLNADVPAHVDGGTIDPTPAASAQP